MTVERYPYTIYYILGHNLERAYKKTVAQPPGSCHIMPSPAKASMLIVILVSSRSSSYLVDADGIEHGAELVPVFGAIDIFGTRPQDVNACLCGVEYIVFFLSGKEMG